VSAQQSDTVEGSPMPSASTSKSSDADSIVYMNTDIDWPTSRFPLSESAWAVTKDKQNKAPCTDAPTEDRITYVLESIKTAGFANVESMLSKYYLSDLSKLPNLANAQRLSRKRRLPGLLAKLAEHMYSWTSWEAEGCKEEFVQSAETVLLAEYRKIGKKDELLDCLVHSQAHDRAVEDGKDQEAIIHALSEVGGVFRDEVSYLLLEKSSMLKARKASEPVDTHDNPQWRRGYERPARRKSTGACSNLLTILFRQSLNGTASDMG